MLFTRSVVTLIASSWVVAAVGSVSLAANSDQINIHWRVPREDVGMVREQLRFAGQITPDETTRDDNRGLPLIYVFAGFVSLPYLVDALIAAARGATCGGVVIDGAASDITIVCEPRLDGGIVVVRSPEGIEVQRFEMLPDPSDLLGALNTLKAGG